jgi:prepilin signal peptidase PulO-like enzyme (type II secretory pathway)
MQILFFLLSFIIGAFIASFLGVIITRLRDLSRSNLQSVLIGRSACDHCNQTLTRRQLIPLLGYCFQRGKCYSCKTKIPSWMSWFELILGIVFALLYLQF